MNVRDVISFLSGEQHASQLQARISEEVEIWAARLRERGRSSPIQLSGQSTDFYVTPSRAVRLLDAFLTGDLSAAEFAYVLDAMLLGEMFSLAN